MGKPCKEKEKFKTFTEAKAFATKYHEDIVLTFHPMTAYYCNKHRGYHVGHDRYTKKVDKNSAEDVE